MHYSDIRTLFAISLAAGGKAVVAKLRSIVDNGSTTPRVGRKKPYALEKR
jgi:hypothetical protein